MLQDRNKKNVENSEIGPDLETLSSNKYKLVDSNLNQLSFIQALGREALVWCVGYQVLYENVSIEGEEGGDPPKITKL